MLDFGCGSGRDSKAFKDAGYEVVAVDGSIELAKAASELIGQDVVCSYFQDFETDKRFDGIWACASLLHLQKDELPAVISKLVSYLKPNGKLYMSFKYGSFEGHRNGRYYTDFTEESMTKLFKEIGITEGFDYFITSDVRPGRGEEKWLNVWIVT
ncbi:MAG: class I SAM-dependent methyltransferase [Anaerovoracaceae bacterium]